MLGVLILVWFLAHAADTWLDSIGWVTHDHDTPVWIHGDWMVGEYRDCGMRTTTPFAGIVQSQEARAELPRLFCGKNWADEGVSEFEIAMPDPDVAVNAILGKGDWGALDSSFHILPVIYHGRLGRPDAVFVSGAASALVSLWCATRSTESNNGIGKDSYESSTRDTAVDRFRASLTRGEIRRMTPNRNNRIFKLAPTSGQLPKAITFPICPTRPSRAPCGSSGSGAWGKQMRCRRGGLAAQEWYRREGSTRQPRRRRGAVNCQRIRGRNPKAVRARSTLCRPACFRDGL